MNCVNQKRNLERCNCSYPSCPRKGICCECIAYHSARGELPACYFSKDQEATWNRSINYFIQCNN
ncbi:MAG: hypothetical protein DRP27_05225 [Thermotogae bacterium]|nr:MAG: hypothetical protein DRP27_05225 [Thermotogota bacterium]